MKQKVTAINLLSDKHILVSEIWEAQMVSFVSTLKDEIVADIEDRIAAWTYLPKGIFFPCLLLFYEFLIYVEEILEHLSCACSCYQKMGSPFKYYAMSMVRNMTLILITLSTRLIKSSVATALPLY